MLFHLKFVAFTFVVPLLLINAFVKKVYGLSLGQVCINIISRYSEVDKLFDMDGYYWTVILMTLIFSWMLLIPFGSFLDGIYLQILGKRQQLIYVGEKEEGSQYVTKGHLYSLVLVGTPTAMALIKMRLTCGEQRGLHLPIDLS